MSEDDNKLEPVSWLAKIEAKKDQDIGQNRLAKNEAACQTMSSSV